MVKEITVAYQGVVRSGSVNLFHFSDLFPDAALSLAVANLIAGMRTRVVSGATLSWDGEIRRYNETNGQLISVTTGTPVSGPGSNGSNAAPDNVAVYTRLRTAAVAGGRRLAGGTYLSGAPSSVTGSDGNLTSTFRSGVETMFSTFLASLNPGEWVVWSRTHSVVAPITAVNTRPMISQQRRRRS